MIESVWLRALLTVQALGAAAVFAAIGKYNAYVRERMVIAERTRRTLTARKVEGAKNYAFMNQTWELTLYERVKTSVAAVTLLPTRVLLWAAILIPSAVICDALFYLGRRDLARIFAVKECRLLLFIAGWYYVKVTGDRDPRAGVVLMNHCTWIDGLFAASFLKAHPLGEQDHFSLWIFLSPARALGMVFFRRAGSADARQAIRKVITDQALRASSGKEDPLFLFPEGTTHHNKIVMEFKDGAFTPGVPVQPAVLKYPWSNFDPCWVMSGPGVLVLFIRMFCQVVNYCEIDFLPCYQPSEAEKVDGRVFAANVRKEYVRAIRGGATDLNLSDVQLQNAALKYGLSPEIGLVGFQKLKQETGVDVQAIKELLKVFRKWKRKDSSLVSLEEFQGWALKIVTDKNVNENKILEVFRPACEGEQELDFRQFLCYMLLPSPGAGVQWLAVPEGECALRTAVLPEGLDRPDSELTQAVATVGLEGLLEGGGLDSRAVWTTKLGYGEQRRLFLARALVLGPP
eukprot:CAMPEP_0204262452 /NCGR_PEP_ID=MMETSP0468-20130131/7691_1 /ASSEMBLY_ACC=CAM_ASM_000383 /TAXON_ID=2969 /ORGANISM="Oxyrrhis marina" /LENGTH=514 /DNA_ID=CAMNT_0051237119 /DNA_START=47 /DNA_END=1591 /DNA_ORIENTATION=-